MKKQLLILASALCLSLSANAQAIYTEPFTGTTLPGNWGGATPDYTLTANNKLIVTMNDSVGPQQLPASGSPAGNFKNFYYVLPAPVNMAVGCKCVTFDVDNTGNSDMTFYVQAADVNQGPPNYNHYTDNNFVAIAANYVGTVTVNFAGQFKNNYSGGGLLDSTQIKSLDFQPVGKDLNGVAPYHKKFMGTFSIDNFVVCTPTPEINVKKGTTSILSGGTSTLASVVSGSTGTPEVFTIENTGNAALTITNITKSAGANASEFTLGTIPTTVAAGSTATFSVTFAPTSVATGKTVTITISNNDSDEGTYTLVLHGDGTAVSTAVSDAQANISSTKLYPNPVSDMANVELNLKSSSEVKVILSDLLGKEVMTIATGTMSSLSESFSVANLHKGIYTVNYFVNGSAAKAELLMVK